MLRTNRTLLLLVLSSLSLLLMAGCGSGASIVTPVMGGFTNSSLNGTYAFSISGQNAAGFFAVAGSFQANGSGALTGGTLDFTSPSGVFTNQALTGSYAVRSDGRTTATVTSTNVALNLDFVLLNTSSGLAIRFQSTATGSGSIDLQSASAFNLASLAGSLAFNVAGVDSGGTNPESSVGLVTFDATGAITSGVLDDHDLFFAATTNLPVTPASGAVSSPAAGNGRGTVTITTTLGPRTFAYYVVDANHVKLVEIDASITTPFLAGDAFRQSSTTVSGSFAFTLAGATTSGTTVFVAGGILNTDGAGNILGTSVTDINNGGGFFQAVATTGTYSVSGGRGTATLNGGFGSVNLAFYPSTGGLQTLEIDTPIVASGTALQQSGAPFSNSSINGSFGLNLTGVDIVNSVEVDGIAQFNTTGTGTLSGAFDFNDGGALSNSLALNGTYTVSSNGRAVATLNPSSLGTFNVIFYMASGSRVLFMEPDVNQVSVGVFASQ
ncbi:MAG TPA: hypothetical protein VI488_02360 [Candidatus Angelobacter sp.]